MAEQLIKVPDIGGAEGAEIVEVLVAPGDMIETEQSLVVVESDKASMEIPAPMSGVVGELRVAVGDTVSEGDVILALTTDAVAADSDADAPNSEATANSDTDADRQTQTSLGDAPLDSRQEDIQTAVANDTQAGSSDAEVAIDVTIPDLGSDEGADLVELLVEVGAAVAEGDSLVLLESDKASMEVPAPVSGTLIEWLMEPGTTVKEGMIIARLAAAHANATDQGELVATQGDAAQQSDAPAATSNSTSTAAPAEAPASAEAPKTATLSPAAVSGSLVATGSGSVYAGPAVRKLAREFGVDLNQVTGTGAKGRIVKEDLQQFVTQSLANARPASGGGLPEIPEVDYERFGATERMARSRIDKLTANNMVRSWLNVPHVTQFDDADISDMERFRKGLKSEAADRGVRLTPIPFILKACAVALRDHPKLKSSLADNGETLVMKDYCHIGMAVDTPAGLVVPVIRDVDKKSVWTLAAEVAELAERARDKQLKPDDMQGGVFTVSSLGTIGGRGFTPIINAPEVAILGVGRAAVQPVWDGEVFRPHTLLPLALSYDHRVVNGGDGGRFLTTLTSLLADVKRMVM